MRKHRLAEVERAIVRISGRKKLGKIRRRIRFLSRDEGRTLFNDQARRCLDMSGEEFVRKWNAKEFKDSDRPEIMQVAFLMPFYTSDVHMD